MLYNPAFWGGGNPTPPLSIMPLLYWRSFALLVLHLPTLQEADVSYYKQSQSLFHELFINISAILPSTRVGSLKSSCLNSSLAHQSYLFNPQNSFQAIPSSTFPLPTPTLGPTDSINPTASQFISQTIYVCVLHTNVRRGKIFLEQIISFQDSSISYCCPLR